VTTLKRGDRVRVTGIFSKTKCQIGDKGTIVRETPLTSSDLLYYVVAMDKDFPDTTGVVFAADEIERDL
jgi:hypothetical protein